MHKIPTWLFPSVLCFLDLCAAVVWIGNARTFGADAYLKAVYWLSAAVLTVSVTVNARQLDHCKKILQSTLSEVVKIKKSELDDL